LSPSSSALPCRDESARRGIFDRVQCQSGDNSATYEFNWLFYHYYFRSVQERTKKMLSAADKKKDQKSLFLDETDGWLAVYKPGSLKQKRVDMFKRMKGFSDPWKGPSFRLPGGPPL